MKITKSITLTITTAMLLLSGCASYQASSLTSFVGEIGLQKKTSSTVTNGDILVVAKAFDDEACMKYLDRNVLGKGYQPVQLYIQNNSDKNYVFSLEGITLPVASFQEVARKVHTNTVGRAVGYGIGGLIIWPLIIPAVVDGMRSSEANEKLDSDFAAKAASDQVIYSKSHFNKVIFVPVKKYQEIFSITLIDQENFNLEVIEVKAS